MTVHYRNEQLWENIWLFLSGQVVIFPQYIVGQVLLCGVLAYGQPMSCQGDMAAIMPLHWMNFCYECVYLWHIQYYISIKIVMHVAGSWISCRISSITYITISVTTIQNVHLSHWFYYSIHRHRGRRAGSLVVVGCTGCCHSDTSRCVGDGGVVVAGAFYIGASFLCVFW